MMAILHPSGKKASIEAVWGRGGSLWSLHQEHTCWVSFSHGEPNPQPGLCLLPHSGSHLKYIAKTRGPADGLGASFVPPLWELRQKFVDL